jgi:hypothetical protein
VDDCAHDSSVNFLLAQSRLFVTLGRELSGEGCGKHSDVLPVEMRVVFSFFCLGALVLLLRGGGFFFGVGDEGGEARVAVEGLEIVILFDHRVDGSVEAMVDGLTY